MNGMATDIYCLEEGLRGLGLKAAPAAVIVFETFIGARRSAGRKSRGMRITVSPV